MRILLILMFATTLLANCGSTLPAAESSASGATVEAIPTVLDQSTPDEQASHSVSTETTNTASGIAPNVDACALASQADAEELLGKPVNQGVSTPDAPFICGWTATDGPQSVTIQVWTTERLKREAQGMDAAMYYQSTRALVGSAFELPPEEVTGVGEQAVWAGKNAGSIMGMQGQMLALSGDALVQFVTIGPERASVEVFARKALAKYGNGSQ